MSYFITTLEEGGLSEEQEDAFGDIFRNFFEHPVVDSSPIIMAMLNLIIKAGYQVGLMEMAIFSAMATYGGFTNQEIEALARAALSDGVVSDEEAILLRDAALTRADPGYFYDPGNKDAVAVRDALAVPAEGAKVAIKPQLQAELFRAFAADGVYTSREAAAMAALSGKDPQEVLASTDAFMDKYGGQVAVKDFHEGHSPGLRSFLKRFLALG